MLISGAFYCFIKYAACQRPTGPLLFNKLELELELEDIHCESKKTHVNVRFAA